MFTPKLRASTIGVTRATMDNPLFGPFKYSKPLCTLDISIHVNTVVVSAVLALDTILTDTKKKVVWFSAHISRCKLKPWYSRHIPRCKVAVLVETRSTTIGLLSVIT